MKRFAHIDALTVDEAVSYLRRYGDGARAIAGGTDLLGKMKDRILPRYPEAIVNLKTGVSRLVAEKNQRIRVLIKPGEGGGGLDIPVPGNENKGAASKNGAKK